MHMIVIDCLAFFLKIIQMYSLGDWRYCQSVTYGIHFFNAFTHNILGLPGEKGERGSQGIGTRGQRGLPGPPGMSSCNLTPPHFNRSISLLIISRVCAHTCLSAYPKPPD